MPIAWASPTALPEALVAALVPLGVPAQAGGASGGLRLAVSGGRVVPDAVLGGTVEAGGTRLGCVLRPAAKRSGAGP